MKNSTSLDGVIKRHSAFWKRQPVDRPLIGFLYEWEASIGEGFGLKAGYLKAEDLDPETFVAAYEEGLRGAGLLEGDLLRVASPLLIPWKEKTPEGNYRWRSSISAFMAWAEAIIGCPIQVLTDSISAETLADSEDKLAGLSLDRNPWFAKLMEITRALHRKFGGSYPVAPPLLRGPADMVAALLGSEKMCLEVIDHPDRVKSLTQKCTEVWLEANQRLHEGMAQFQGGYCNARFELWAPGISPTSQEDCALLFSSAHHSEFLMPASRRTLAISPYSAIHTHSSAIRKVDSLLTIPELGAIEVHVDPKGPSISTMLPTFARIQKEKSLILGGAFSKEQLEDILGHLNPAGLCLMLRSKSQKPALELAHRLVEEKR